MSCTRTQSARLDRVADVKRVTGPRDAPALSTAGGRTVLVSVAMRGDPDDAKEHVAPIETAVAAVERAHPGVRADEAGTATINKAFDDVVEKDLRRADVVAVSAIFATMTFLDSKELGVCLAVAVLLDATIVRGIALPAAVALLGDRRWRVSPRPAAVRGWDDGRTDGARAGAGALPASGHAR